MKHKHHIIPKHMGGTDDPSNLVELTIEEHAEAHKLLWEEHGLKEDWLAWQGLAKMITKEQIIKELCSHKGEKHPMYGRRGPDSPLYGRKHSDERKLKISLALSNHVRSEEHMNKLNSRFTDDYLEKVSNSISRNWKITTPEGIVLIVRNLSNFCKLHGLSKSGMSQLAKHSRPYKGYKCEKLG